MDSSQRKASSMSYMTMGEAINEASTEFAQAREAYALSDDDLALNLLGMCEQVSDYCAELGDRATLTEAARRLTAAGS